MTVLLVIHANTTFVGLRKKHQRSTDARMGLTSTGTGHVTRRAISALPNAGFAGASLHGQQVTLPLAVPRDGPERAGINGQEKALLKGWWNAHGACHPCPVAPLAESREGAAVTATPSAPWKLESCEAAGGTGCGCDYEPYDCGAYTMRRYFCERDRRYFCKQADVALLLSEAGAAVKSTSELAAQVQEAFLYVAPVHASVVRDSSAALDELEQRLTIAEDPDHSPVYQDEYQRLWHQAAAERDEAAARAGRAEARAEAAEAIARNAHGHIQRALTERDRALGMAERLERLADLYAHRLGEHPRNCQWCRMAIDQREAEASEPRDA